MKKLIAITLLALVAITGCTKREVELSIETHTHCVMLVPSSENDPDGVFFETWEAGRTLAYGSMVWGDKDGEVGYASSESDEIWGTRECALADSEEI